MKNLKTIAIFGLIVLVTFSCKKDEPLPEPVKSVSPTTPYNFNIPANYGFPTIMNIPADNPTTVEGVKLGRYLFYDGRIAGREDEGLYMSCSSCHIQENSFEIGSTTGYAWGLPDSGTVNQTKTPHTMLPFVNLVFNSEGYLWNGAIYNENPKLGGYGQPAELPFTFTNLESVLWLAIYAPHEFNSTVEKSVAAIQNIDIYPPMFEAAFGTPEINIDRMSKAIAQFIRTLIATDSKVQKYYRGEALLTDAERRGAIIFATEKGDCFHCHGGDASPLFTTNKFYNNAKDSSFTGTFSDPRDRYAVTKDPQDLGAYKATTLINIEKTGPYMHDGRFMTLMEVIDFYSEGLVYSPYANPLMKKLQPPWGNGAQLIPSEKQDLLAFLKALTDEDFLTNPDFARPSDLPDFP